MLAQHHRTCYFGKEALQHVLIMMFLVQSMVSSALPRIANIPPSINFCDLWPHFMFIFYLVRFIVCSVSMAMHCRALLLQRGLYISGLIVLPGKHTELFKIRAVRIFFSLKGLERQLLPQAPTESACAPLFNTTAAFVSPGHPIHLH